MSRRLARTRGIPAGTWFGARSFHSFMTAPATSRILDTFLQDNAATDAAIEAARDDERGDEQPGSNLRRACGFCGQCS